MNTGNATPPHHPLCRTDLPAERGWQRSVDDLLEQVAAERGIDFDPTPTVVAAALPGLVQVVENLAAGMDTGDRRSLAAALAALSHAVGTMRLSPSMSAGEAG